MQKYRHREEGYRVDVVRKKAESLDGECYYYAVYEYRCCNSNIKPAWRGDLSAKDFHKLFEPVCLEMEDDGCEMWPCEDGCGYAMDTPTSP